MGFKTSGFKKFSFNPMGFKDSITTGINIPDAVQYTRGIATDGVLTDLISGNNILVVDAGGTLIPTGQPIAGNYLKQATTDATLITADATLGNQWYTGGVPNIVEIVTMPNADNKQQFISLLGETWGQILYEDSRTNEEEVPAGQIVNINEPLLDSEGEDVIDINGLRLYVFRNGAIII